MPSSSFHNFFLFPIRACDDFLCRASLRQTIRLLYWFLGSPHLRRPQRKQTTVFMTIHRTLHVARLEARNEVSSINKKSLLDASEMCSNNGPHTHHAKSGGDAKRLLITPDLFGFSTPDRLFWMMEGKLVWCGDDSTWTFPWTNRHFPRPREDNQQ